MQKVVLDGHKSSPARITSGVPQGSILGPLLFTISMDPILNLSLSKDARIVLYADDILLYKPIRTHADATAFQMDATMVTDWITSSGLKLNSAKTKLLTISRKCFPPQLSININGTPVSRVSSLQYLGVTISSDLSWSSHIINTCNKARKQLGFLYRNFYQADRKNIAYLYKSTVLPLLDYCNCVWDPYHATYAAKTRKSAGIWS